jgi:hypothetical protein
MVAAIRIIPIALYLLWRDDDPLPVFAATCEQGRTDIPDLRRIAVLFVATALGRIIRHVPRAVLPLWRSLRPDPAPLVRPAKTSRVRCCVGVAASLEFA